MQLQVGRQKAPAIEMYYLRPLQLIWFSILEQFNTNLCNLMFVCNNIMMLFTFKFTKITPAIRIKLFFGAGKVTTDFGYFQCADSKTTFLFFVTALVFEIQTNYFDSDVIK